MPAVPSSQTTAAVESIIARMLLVSEDFTSSGSSAAIQLIQNYLYFLGQDQKCVALEDALIDARTERTKLAAENESLQGSQDRLTVVEEQNAKLQEELRLSRANVEKITGERDVVIAAKDNSIREAGGLRQLNSKLAETQVVLQTKINTLNEASTVAAAKIEELKKKHEDDVAKLQAEHTSVVDAHVLVAELRQQKIQRL